MTATVHPSLMEHTKCQQTSPSGKSIIAIQYHWCVIVGIVQYSLDSVNPVYVQMGFLTSSQVGLASQASYIARLFMCIDLFRSDGIAWKSDLDHKFGNYMPENFNTIEALRGGGEIQGSVRDDEHFAVWMRTAALPHFRKLWGVIDQPIPKDSLVKIRIKNRYNTYQFDGQKSIVLSTTSWLGGKNDVIGISYVTAGAISMLCSVTYLLLHLQFPRKQGDERFLSWNHKNQ